jgi:arylsulfatase
LHEKAMAWLDGIGPGEPYLLFLHYWDPHADYEPPAPYDRFLGGEYRGRITGHGVLQDPRIRPDMPEADLKRLLDLYRGEIRWTDEWIGKVVRRLEERGGLDRTMMVVTADHGEEFFEHGVRGHRHNLYGPSVRIPMILRLPARFPAGAVRDAPASLVDVLPTVAAAVGAPAPRRTHGVDLARPPDGPRAVFASLEDRLEAARDGKWKVIRSRDGTVEQLFRVDRDPGERADRRAEDPEAWARLLGALRRPERGQWAPDSLPFPELDPDTEAELRALGYAD